MLDEECQWNVRVNILYCCSVDVEPMDADFEQIAALREQLDRLEARRLLIQTQRESARSPSSPTQQKKRKKRKKRRRKRRRRDPSSSSGSSSSSDDSDEVPPARTQTSTFPTGPGPLSSSSTATAQTHEAPSEGFAALLAGKGIVKKPPPVATVDDSADTGLAVAGTRRKTLYTLPPSSRSKKQRSKKGGRKKISQKEKKREAKSEVDSTINIKFLEQQLQMHWIADPRKSTETNKLPMIFSFKIDCLTPAPTEWQVRSLVNKQSSQFKRLRASILARPWIPRHGKHLDLVSNVDLVSTLAIYYIALARRNHVARIAAI